jgi:hypothetical protein
MHVVGLGHGVTLGRANRPLGHDPAENRKSLFNKEAAISALPVVPGLNSANPTGTSSGYIRCDGVVFGCGDSRDYSREVRLPSSGRLTSYREVAGSRRFASENRGWFRQVLPRCAEGRFIRLDSIPKHRALWGYRGGGGIETRRLTAGNSSVCGGYHRKPLLSDVAVIGCPTCFKAARRSLFT